MQGLNRTPAAGGKQHGMELASAAMRPVAATREEAELVDFVLHAGSFRERLARQQQQGRPRHRCGQWQS